MQAEARKKEYTGGNYAYKKILRLNDEGKKVISPALTKPFLEQSADYISSAYLNPNGVKVVYCIPLDIDAKDEATDKKWLDSGEKVNWEKVVGFLQETYPDIFQYLLFVVRSTGGRGLSLIHI